MLCYRDRTFCSDGDDCATHCTARFDKTSYEKACKEANFEYPVAWASYRDNCRSYKYNFDKKKK